MNNTPRYYKWFPDKEYDLGTHPVEGDWTLNDRIITYDCTGMNVIYYPSTTGEWGRNVTKKVGKRVMQVWEPGVTLGPVTVVNPNDPEDTHEAPVWFSYCGDGVCTVKVPNGQLEPVEV